MRPLAQTGRAGSDRKRPRMSEVPHEVLLMMLAYPLEMDGAPEVQLLAHVTQEGSQQQLYHTQLTRDNVRAMFPGSTLSDNDLAEQLFNALRGGERSNELPPPTYDVRERDLQLSCVYMSSEEGSYSVVARMTPASDRLDPRVCAMIAGLRAALSHAQGELASCRPRAAPTAHEGVSSTRSHRSSAAHDGTSAAAAATSAVGGMDGDTAARKKIAAIPMTQVGGDMSGKRVAAKVTGFKGKK